ncbi:methyltransferase domain-containing protein [Oscillatoria sp. CS-180]|uniref:methyltransferase domain-containing protein n=1 Tax=Oscillatoria sp. CS-180 TaxID=3021720 RepID=UPI0023309BE0|nr:methyltransferase domain-containing protein [Oscillatoria sp. CS-180]MDB9528789.1 methyltransferase domain-containing protein [Oscillatoria sp. CS-180]
MSIFQQFKQLVMQQSRASKLTHFYSLCKTDSSVLDVGVSCSLEDETENLFLKEFRLPSSQYTGLAVQPMDDLRSRYPDKRFVEYPGGVFPFTDKSFDWVFSNAVIEHVGNREAQLLFINEMLRVGKNVFFTTPNKGFPVESHTNVLFKHWHDDDFYEWCRENQPHWNRDTLLLFGMQDLKAIMKSSAAQQYSIRANRLLGLPMTLTVVCTANMQ